MKRVNVLLVIIFLCLNFSSCNDIEDNSNKEENEAKQQLEADIILGCDSYMSSMAQTYLMKNIIEQNGYEAIVKIIPQKELYNDLSSNFVQAIDYPVITNNIKINENIDDLGANFSTYKKGLVVPNYVNIAEISELKLYGKKFNNKIYTFTDVPLLKTLANTAIKKYNLKMSVGVKTDDEMDKFIEKSIDEQQWFVLAGYTPHWILKKYNLRYLEDTMFVFEDKKESHTLINKVLETENKEIYNILNRFYLYDWELNDLLLNIKENGYDQFNDTIKSWLDNNQYIKDRCCES